VQTFEVDLGILERRGGPDRPFDGWKWKQKNADHFWPALGSI
jgi:hypothetical protein